MPAFAASVAFLFAACASAGVAEPTDLFGKPVHLFPAGHSRITVLIFVRTDCPISNRYAPEIERVYRSYAGKADFYLVYADSSESPTAIRGHLLEYGYTLPALRDPGHQLVALAKARVTPEAAVFSSRGELLYHGRIDNRYVDFGKAMAQATSHDLENALQAALAGRPVIPASTHAIGCFLADVQ
jgi:hypothetical protein